MLAQSQIDQFQADGYLKSGRILNDGQVTLLQGDIERVIASRGSGGEQPVLCRNMSKDASLQVWQIVDIWLASEPFRELIFHPTIGEEMAQLTGAETLRIWHDQIQYKPAGTGAPNLWHQDAPYWPTLTPMTEVSAWVALDDVDEENGCMSMVPGSHRWGNHIDFLHTLKAFSDMPQSYEGKPVEVRLCPVRRGEVHYHHALTWHGSHANTSSRPRRAIALHFMTGQTRFVAAGEHPMKPYIEVADGEVVRGEYFPAIWENGAPVAAGKHGPLRVPAAPA